MVNAKKRIRKFHILEHLKSDEAIICYLQEILNSDYDMPKEMLKDELHTIVWALRLRSPKIRRWLRRLSVIKKVKK